MTVPAFFRRSFVALSLLLTLCALQKVHAAPAPKYTITPILPPNDIIPAPELNYANPRYIVGMNLTAINDSGKVIGSYFHDFGAYRGNIGFVWQNGQFTILKPSAVASNIVTYPTDINNSGVVAGHAQGGNVYEPYSIPLKWLNYMDEPVVLPAPANTHPYATAINTQGQVLGSSTANDGKGYLWKADSSFDKVLPQGDRSVLYLAGLNDSGIACGQDQNYWYDMGTRAIRYDTNTMTLTPLESPLDINGKPRSAASAINILGITAGGSLEPVFTVWIESNCI